MFKKVKNSGIYKQINMKDEVLESDVGKFYLKSFLTNQNYIEPYLLYENILEFISELKSETNELSAKEIYENFLLNAVVDVYCTTDDFSNLFDEKLRSYEETIIEL